MIITDDVLLAWSVSHLRYANDEIFVPDWWQSRYLRSKKRFTIANKSRRVGWSYITAIKGLAKALTGESYTKQYVSYSLEDAKEKIRVAIELFDSIPAHLCPKKAVSRSKTQLEFLDRNGRSISRLVSLPCRQPRGKGGDISLDEFAFHQKDDLIYTAALPIISRGGDLEIGSTPFGNKGRFYELLTDVARYPEFERTTIPWYHSPALCRDVLEASDAAKVLPTEQLISQFGTVDVQAIFASMSLADFDQEYACSFRDELAAFIPLEMIQRATPIAENEIIQYRDVDSLIVDYRPADHGELYAGYDVGRTNDASELTILGYYPDQGVRTVWASLPLRKASFGDQEAMLVKVMQNLPIHRLAIDSSGLGMQLAENMGDRFQRRVEACVFTGPFKETLAENVYLAFDRDEILLPADRDLQSQIHAMKKTVTAGKHARFDVDSNSRHHGDKFWSLALALYSVGNGKKTTGSKLYQDLMKRKEGGLGGRVRPESRDQVMNKILRLKRGEE